MDLAYLRAHPNQLPTLLRHQRIRETPVAGGSICTASRLTLDDGNSLFVKTWPRGSPPDGFFFAEAAGLRWLAEPAAVPVPAAAGADEAPGTAAGADEAPGTAALPGAPVPEVVAGLDNLLALEWISTRPPSRAAAERFGRELAATHRAGAASFGAPWPGFIGSLPQPNSAHPGPWSEWFVTHRLLPPLRTSADRGALNSKDVARVEGLLARIDRYGGDEPPARIHGDLWPGNLLWTTDRVWLVDPSAHGGHREADLAALELFGGVPYGDRILSAYREAWPLADGWRARRPLHQLHLLLVHIALFGGSWRGAVLAAVDEADAAIPRP